MIEQNRINSVYTAMTAKHLHIFRCHKLKKSQIYQLYAIISIIIEKITHSPLNKLWSKKLFYICNA